MIYISAMIGLALGNYMYQMINDRDWERAFERTFFQMIAIGVVWIIQSISL